MESYADCAVSALVGAQDGKSAADERSRKHEKALVSPEVKVVRMHTKSGEKLMKKMNRAVSFVLIVLAVIAGFTCKPYVGLGAQIDINPPSGTISYPEMGETPIRGSFVLKGTASDDDGIESVSVVFKNIDTKKTIEIGEAGGFTKGYANVSWTLNVQNESTGNKTKNGIEHKLVKDYRIPDGEYEVIVTVTDTGSKKSSFTKLYKIDNTPPVLILDRPSTATTSSSIQPDSYGSVFTVKGAAKDRYAIEDLTFKVPAANISVSKRFVGENISEEIAVATKNGAGFTDPLYKYSDDNGNSPIQAQLFLTDNARSFKDDGDPGLGNTSNWYYVRDDQIRSVLADGYTVDVISDYFAGKEGDASSSDFPKRLLAKLYTAEGESIRTKLENARVMTEGGDQRYSIFTLNPNKSPGFSVTNGTNFLSSYPVSTPNASLPLGTTAYFSDALPPQVYLKLVRNKDNNPLVQTPDYNGYRASPIVINMYKCTSEPKYVTYGDKKLLEVDRATVPAYSLKFANLTAEDETKGVVSGANELTVKWQLPNQAAFSAGYYMIQVEGTDTASNEFVAYDDANKPSGGVFIIKYELAGQNLRISPSSPSGFVKEDFNVSASVFSPGMVSEVRYKIVTNVEANASATAGASDTLLTNSSGNTWKTATSVQISTIGNEGAYKALFWAKDNAGNTTTASMPFVKDTKAPVPKITYPKSNNIVAGTVPIQGTLDDKPATGINDYANVKLDGTKYIIGKQTTEPTAATTSGWRVMDEPGVALWKFTYDLDTLNAGDAVAVNGSIYDIPIYILTEDNAGNKAVTKLIIKYDSEGDKPIVTVSNPRQGQSTGGTIQIFGTAASRVGGYNDAGKVYIQFSKDGNFTNTANGNMTFGTTGGGYDADWHQGGNGQLVPGTDDVHTGGASWQMSINGNGAFNNPNGDSWEVYFRLRAENKNNHKLGVWSEPIKIFIDKSNPTIGSPDPLKVGTDIYAPDMWIKDGKTLTGSLFDDSGIKEITISSPELLRNKQYTLEEAKNKGWIVEDTAHAPSSAPSAAIKNYKLQIPLTLEGASSLLSEEARIKGKITLKIKIVEGASKNLATEETLSFKFDVTKPAGGLGRYIYRYNGNFAVSSVVNSDLAEQVKQAAGTSADYSKLRLLISNTLVEGKAVKVTGVSGNAIQFTPALSKAGIYNCMLYEEPYIIRNESGKWIVRGVASDSGSGIKKITAKVTVGTVTKSIDITGQSGIEQYTGGQVSWVGEIDLSTLKDGKGKLTCTISDEQGNEYTVPAVDIVVKNKPIAVSDITLMTDIAGSPESFENNAINKALKNVKTDSNLDFTADFASTEFAFKNKDNSKIKVDFTGGYGTVKYQLKKEDGTLLGGLTAITSGDEIDLKDHFGTAADKINNSNGTPTKIILELWGEAAGFTQGTDSAFAKVNITTLFDALDTKPPTVVILPFHWNGEGDNSLYENKRANGHVEIAKINSLGNDHSSVSGKVTLRGFAYDNVKIDSIEAHLPNTTALTVKATRQPNGTWVAEKNMALDGAVLTVETLGADYLGYYVQWTLDWDTEKTSVGLAKEITVRASDGKTTFSDTEKPTAETTGVTRSGRKNAQNDVFANKKPGQFVVFTKGETQYLTRIRSVTGNKATLEDDVPTEATTAYMYDYTANEPKTTVNVVPYITEVVTGLKGADGSHKGSFSRASTGEYPVRAGETIEVKGFNLSGGTVMLGTTSLGTNLNGVSIASSHTSGDLSVTVDSIESVNNKVDITKPYNIEANNENNDILTAKRKLFVWETKPIIDNNFMESPQFVMDKNSNYYMSYGVLAVSGNLSFAMMKNATVTAAQMASSHIIEQCYSKYQNTVIAYDEGGQMYGGASNTDRASNSTSFTFFSREQGSNATGHNGNYNGGTNRRRLENNANTTRNVYDVNRVQIPKLAVRGGSSDAKVALIYYDRNNNTTPVKFRYGTVTAPNTITGGLGHDVSSNGNGSDPYNSGSAEGYEIIADSTTSHKSGLYAAVGLTSTNRAVAVWYDATNAKLIYSYRDMGTSYAEPGSGGDRKTTEWQNNAVVIDGGAPLYVDLIIDDEDGLHIGYYSSGNGGVRYAYLAPAKVKGTAKPATSDFKIATVDTYMNPGTFLKIGVRNEGTKQVPYISYYHNGFYGSANAARIAWFKDGIASAADVKNGVENGKFTGNWVVMTVPASAGIQQYTICQGAPTSGSYANKVIAAYFTNNNYEMAVLKK